MVTPTDQEMIQVIGKIVTVPKRRGHITHAEPNEEAPGWVKRGNEWQKNGQEPLLGFPQEGMVEVG